MTETFLLAALVLHTQITKVARLPGVTCDDVDRDCAHTHSCGDFEGEMERLGVGLGLGVGVALGDGLGLGAGVTGGDGVEVSVGDGEALATADAVVVSDGDAVAEGEVVALALLSRSAVASTELPGTEPQAVLALTAGKAAACAANDGPKMPNALMVNPAAACSAARLANSVLTCASSSGQVHWQSGT